MRAARSILPPSSGNARIRLNMPTNTLTIALYRVTPHIINFATVTIDKFDFSAIDADKSHKNMAKIVAITKLMAGPAIVILDSFQKSFVSSVISETPPKIKRIICLTLIPYHYATRECIISCKNTDMKSITAPAAPIIQYCATVSPRIYCGIKLLASVHAIKTNTMIKVKCNRIGIPRTFAI